jgi:hypothetical protein
MWCVYKQLAIGTLYLAGLSPVFSSDGTNLC